VSLSAIPSHLRDLVLARDDGRCRYCALSQHGQAATFHVDHVVPRSHGGTTSEANLALQCPHCSLHKSNKLSAIDPSTGREAPIFHPLKQEWAEHFAIDINGWIIGKSATGRATTEALDMNHLRPRTARAIQLSLGIIRAPA
jgi:hypothetical protein